MVGSGFLVAFRGRRYVDVMTDIGLLLRDHLLAAGFGPSAIRNNMLRGRAWQRWLGELAPEDATTATMRVFLRQLEESGVGAGARDQYVTARQHLYVDVFRLLRREEFDVPRPTQAPRLPRAREEGWQPAPDKTCARCHRHLDGSAFGASRRAPDGLDSWCLDCRRDYMRGRPTDPARRRENARASAARHPERRRAREMINTEIRAGRMPPAKSLACSDCGEPATSYDHHLGYDHPPDVEPVCYPCHGRRSRCRGEHRRQTIQSPEVNTGGPHAPKVTGETRRAAARRPREPGRAPSERGGCPDP